MEPVEESLIISLRFPKGLRCVDCKAEEIYKLKHHQFKCKKCKKRFRLFTGTLLEGTKITLPQWMMLISGFIENKPVSPQKHLNPSEAEPPETLKTKTGLAPKTIYKALNLIRLAIIWNLPEKEKRNILQSSAIAFGVAYKGSEVNCVPLNIKKLSKKELRKLEEEKQFKEIITKKQIHFLDDPEKKQWNEPTISTFAHYFHNEHEDIAAKLFSKKFHLYLKGAEYLYNQKQEGKKELQIFTDILKKLLVHAST